MGKKYFTNSMNRSLEWIYFQWYQRADKKSWRKVTVTDPWEWLVRRHLASSRQNFGRMKVETRFCLVIMDTHMHHNGELIHTVLAAYKPVKICELEYETYLNKPFIPADSYTSQVSTTYLYLKVGK